ncbi:hypothetical protein KDW88_22005 [Burkholderia cenocepacia]|uniref:hypothetical protein n=1 Tax=Burkholderia cenocepacia TaxID=95486 RepID=UPI001B8ED803|nr:hypothetical protein [Burkholderia cenocepacia]
MKSTLPLFDSPVALRRDESWRRIAHASAKVSLQRMLFTAEVVSTWGRAIGFDMADGVARGTSNPRTQVAQPSVAETDVVETVEHDAIRSGPVALEDAGLSLISCSRHMILPRRTYASQTENPTGRTTGDSR